MQVTRFGHAATLVVVDDKRILIDPGAFSADEVFTLDRLDAIVVTHQHLDHLDADRIGGLLQSNPDALLLADAETAAEQDGFEAHTADDIHTLGGVTIRGIGTTHAEILPTIPRIANTGVTISAANSPTFFHPGDSYASTPDGVDVLAVPLSAPWAKLSETVGFVRAVSPTSFIGIHDAVVSPLGRPIYWRQLTAHAGVDDARDLGPTESATFS